jgi:hypothetical protein
VRNLLLGLWLMVLANVAYGELNLTPKIADIPLQNQFARAVSVPSAANAWGGERAQVAPGAALSDRVVDYQISAELDPAKHRISAQQTLQWRNRSAQAVRTVYLHMYLNAFAHADSTWMQEWRIEQGSAAPSEAPEPALAPDEAGYIRIKRAQQLGSDKAPVMRFVQPDGGPKTDQTVLALDLAQPVMANQILTLKLEFISQLPLVLARTGYFDSFHMGAQWFPKMAVLELAGERGALQPRWNAHEFHLNSEFYADFGHFDVQLTVPKDFQVAATGTQVAPPLTLGNKRRYHFAQGDVHDFAFAADSRFAAPLQASYQRADKSKVQISVFYTPDYVASAQPALDATLAALAYAAQTLGEYPYDGVSVIVPPLHAEEAGGMEYPTLFTVEGYVNPAPGSLDGAALEFVTIHEFFHNFFQGIVASNEFEEPFLDEGVNEFWNNRQLRDSAQTAPVPGVLSVPGLNLRTDRFELARVFAQLDDPQDSLGENSWRRMSDRSYFNIYAHSGLLLRDFEARWGHAKMTQAMRTYYQRWRFRHPSTADFQAVLAEVSQDQAHVDQMFTQFVYSTQVLDDRVLALSSWRRDDAPKNAAYESWVTLRRFGAGVPQTVQVRFADGSNQSQTWDDRAQPKRWAKLRFLSASKALSAELDPGQKYALDRHQLDNSRTLQPDRIASRRWSAESASVLDLIFSLMLGL